MESDGESSLDDVHSAKFATLLSGSFPKSQIPGLLVLLLVLALVLEKYEDKDEQQNPSARHFVGCVMRRISTQSWGVLLRGMDIALSGCIECNSRHAANI